MTARHLHSTDLHPFVGTDVWQLLLSRAHTHADKAFVVWQPVDPPASTVTFAGLARDAAALAAGLSSRGVRRGDRVLIHLDNSPEFLTSWFACTALGAVAVTTNTRSAADELAYYAQDSGAVGAITQPSHAQLLGQAAPQLRFLVSTSHNAGVPADTEAEAFTSLLGDPDAAPVHVTDPLAPCSVQYTSGTTARPKGVLWTHANALWGAKSNSRNESLQPDDIHLCYLPLFHTNALAYSMLASLWVGSTIVLTPKWSTSRFWDISLQHRCTWLSMTGLSLRVLLESTPPAGHKYRLFGTGLCDLPIDERYGVKTIGWWGMTETISHPIVGDAFVPGGAMKMGRPADNYGVKVVREDGALVEPGESGHLLIHGIRGLSMFSEYLNQPAATADSFDPDGWFRTGDLVTPHADGFLTFENRAKDMLRVGAENVSAAEVERVILGVPGVIEVGVVGRPDVKLDEVPVAFIIPASDDPTLEDRIEEACFGMLAGFKRPRAIYRVIQLPRSALNKINKVELRAVATPDADRDTAQKRWIADASLDPSC
jgi:crotonobetaine/carnitine-CoA ligase